MQIVRSADAPTYEAPKHIGVRAHRLQGGEVSGASFCAIGLSCYAPGGRAEMDASPQEKLYVLLSGELTVRLASGEHTVLRPFDSCRIEPNEMRAVENLGGDEAILLVITPPPTAERP